MPTADYNFILPEQLIAQRPVASRDHSRLLVLHRTSAQITHCPCFRDLQQFLRPGDMLVMNNSRVMPARLRGHKSDSGGEVEVLLLEELSRNDWWTLLRPAKRVRSGTRIHFLNATATRSVEAVVIEKNAEGHCRLQFSGTTNIVDQLEQLGEIPLPPYVRRAVEPEDLERYQTVFASRAGSVAAPTAGLHFTTDLLARLGQMGVEIRYLTLHIGLGTFSPVKTSKLAEHRMHEEQFVLPAETAAAISQARAVGRRIIAVGTTTVRVLESVATENNGRLIARTGRTRIFIYPPFDFQVVDGLVTNFHLPQSSLLMLVSAFAAPGAIHGRELMLRAYSEAIRQGYHFYSYGDAMLIV